MSLKKDECPMMGFQAVVRQVDRPDEFQVASYNSYNTSKLMSAQENVDGVYIAASILFCKCCSKLLDCSSVPEGFLSLFAAYTASSSSMEKMEGPTN